MRSVVLLALFCMVPACDDEDGDPSTYVYVEDLQAAAKDAYCTYQARCGLFPDKASCVAAAVTTAFSLDVDTVAAIQAGKIQYNGSNMRRCLDALAGQTCDTTDIDGRVTPAACTDLMHGRGRSGDACFVAAECASGACSSAVTGDTCSAGVCIGDVAPPSEPVPVGMSCLSNPRCVDGARCDASTYTCVPLKAQGVACTSGEECDYGLGCGGTTTATCIHLPTVGQPCSPGLECRDEGLFCDTNAATPTCKQLGVASATCTSGGGQCSMYYPCDTTTGKCTALPTLGKSCSTTFQCGDAASYCDTSTYVCTARKGDGSTCTADAQCASNNCDVTISPALCTTETGCY